MTPWQEIIYTGMGLFLGFLAGMLWGVHLVQQWTVSEKAKMVQQISDEHTVGHPDLP